MPADMKVKASAVRFCSEGVNWPFSGFGERVVSKTEVGRPSPVGAERRALIRELQCYIIAAKVSGGFDLVSEFER